MLCPNVVSVLNGLFCIFVWFDRLTHVYSTSSGPGFFPGAPQDGAREDAPRQRAGESGLAVYFRMPPLVKEGNMR